MKISSRHGNGPGDRNGISGGASTQLMLLLEVGRFTTKSCMVDFKAHGHGSRE